MRVLDARPAHTTGPLDSADGLGDLFAVDAGDGVVEAGVPDPQAAITAPNRAKAIAR